MNWRAFTKKKHQATFIDGNWATLIAYDKDSKGRVFSVDFCILEIMFNTDDGRPCYRNEDDQPTTDPRDADAIVDGFIKWDGCCQWHANLVHTDSLEELQNFSTVLTSIYQRTSEVLWKAGP